MSWCELNTHWTNRLGSQLWFINLAIFPVEPASMQKSGTLWSSGLSSELTAGKHTACDRLCQRVKWDKLLWSATERNKDTHNDKWRNISYEMAEWECIDQMLHKHLLPQRDPHGHSGDKVYRKPDVCSVQSRNSPKFQTKKKSLIVGLLFTFKCSIKYKNKTQNENHHQHLFVYNRTRIYLKRQLILTCKSQVGDSVYMHQI